MIENSKPVDYATLAVLYVRCIIRWQSGHTETTQTMAPPLLSTGTILSGRPARVAPPRVKHPNALMATMKPTAFPPQTSHDRPF